MTLDTTSDSTTTAAATTGGEAAAEATPTAPARAKRTTRTRATRATKAAPSADDAAAEPTAAAVPLTGEAAGPAAGEAPVKPVRKRATRPSKAAVAAESGADAADARDTADIQDAAGTRDSADTRDSGTKAAVRATTTARASRARSTASSAAAEAPAAATPEVAAPSSPTAAPVEEQAPAAPKRRRATRKTAAAVADVPVEAPVPGVTPAPAASPEPAAPAVTPAPAEAVAAPAAGSTTAAPARRSRRVTRPAGHTTAAEQAPVAPAPVAPVVAAPVADLEDEEIAEAVGQAEQTSVAVTEGGLDVFAELGRRAPTAAPTQVPATQARATRNSATRTSAAQTSATQAPAGRTPATRTPATQPSAPAPSSGERPASARLATTALLFQAPEATPRRRRRAQAPSGSPEVISAVAQAAEADLLAEQEAAAQTATIEPVEQTPVSSRRRGRGRGRATRAEAPAQDTAIPTSTEAESPEAEAPVIDEIVEVEPDVIAVDTVDERTDEDAVDGEESSPRRRRRRGGRGRRSRGTGDGGAETDDESEAEPAVAVDEPVEAEDRIDAEADEHDEPGSSRRRRRRRRSGRGGDGESAESAPRSRSGSRGSDEVTALRGSTRLEAKRQRRREGRDAGRRRQIITEAEFLARRESVERSMVVRESNGRTQIAVLEDGVLVEHYVSRQAQVSMAGNVYLGRVQNVLPSMEAAFIDVGKGRNAVLYAGEVNWDAAGLEGGQPRRIEQALKSGDSVLAQVTKDPIGHKGARLTSQITLAGRYLVYVPGGGMTGISRKLPEPERARLKKILREVVPDSAGVIVRTAAEGASEEELRADIARLQSQWEAIEKKAKTASAPALLQGEPDLAIRVVRDIFNDDFSSLVVEGDEAWSTISGYIGDLAPDLAQKVSRWTGQGDVFAAYRVDEQLAKGMDRKVWLPSGGSLVIDRTEAMTVVDVNTGKFTGAGGTLEETVTRNNLEAAEEIVRQLRLRDIGGIIVIDFIDMVLESNRDLVLRRLVECLGRDRTKHQVAEVTSLGLVQMTRKRVGQGLVEAFSETCEHCNGRGFIVHTDPVEKTNGRPDASTPQPPASEAEPKRSRRKRGGTKEQSSPAAPAAAVPVLPEARETVNATLATIAAAAAHAHLHDAEVHAAEAVDPVAPAQEGVAEAQPAPVVEAESDSHPVLDVFAALGNLAARTPEVAPATDEPTGSVELTPVDPGLFDLSDTEGEQSQDDMS